MMNTLLRLWAIFIVTAKRLFSQRALVIATLLGLVISTALTMSIPLYSDAIYYRIFNEKINQNNGSAGAHVLPPFALMFRYSGSLNKSVELEDLSKVDNYLTNLDSDSFGLPDKMKVRSIKTDNFQLFSNENAIYVGVKQPLSWISFGFITDLQDHININQGNFPTDSDPTNESTVNVLMSEALATKLGVQPGENYIAFTNKTSNDNSSVSQFPLKVTGIWSPKDADDPYWFYTPSMHDDMLIVTENTFKQRISPFIKGEVYSAVWYHVLDDSKFVISEAGPIVGRLSANWRQADALLSGTRLDVSPLDSLISYQKSVRLLTFFLYAFSIPFLVLVLAFTSLVSSLSVESRRNEIAMLRSRGTTILQMLGIATLEGIILGLVAMVISTPISQWITSIIGKTRSFLKFETMPGLRVELSWTAIYTGLIIVAIAMIMQIIPTLSASQHTVVTYKQDRARSLIKPWWQRVGLDFLLLIPAIYGAYLLKQQGRIAVINSAVSTNPFENPLLFLVPVLWIFAISLVFLRLLPLIMGIISWLTSYTKSTGLLLATRHLSRSPSFYTTPLMMLILTLSLSAFTASLAETLDNSLYDQTYYKNGADYNLSEFGEYTDSTSSAGSASSASSSATTSTDTSTDTASGTSDEESGSDWVFLPVSEYLNVPGVESATRVGTFEAETEVAGNEYTGEFFGVDRDSFPKVTYWRRDFARDNLGTLMNSLGAKSDGIIVTRRFLAQTGLKVGDKVKISVKVFSTKPEVTYTIVNALTYFPEWYPDGENVLFVGNLQYLFQQAGGEYPYNVLLKTSANVTNEQINSGMDSIGLKGSVSSDTRTQISNEQTKPNRQGLFGILTVGFIAAALLTVLSFLLYAFFSFRRRFIEFGVLQAIGLSPVQMTAFLASELGFLILLGTGIGTALGIGISRVFIPYMQLGSDAASQIPPYQVIIAWPTIFKIYGLMGVLFVVALTVLVGLLMKMKIFQAIKLGETI
jgi:putative ABC transport system permease protein